MPCLNNRLITAPVDRSGNPFGPIAVGLVVTDENFHGLRSGRFETAALEPAALGAVLNDRPSRSGRSLAISSIIKGSWFRPLALSRRLTTHSNNCRPAIGCRCLCPSAISARLAAIRGIACTLIGKNRITTSYLLH